MNKIISKRCKISLYRPPYKSRCLALKINLLSIDEQLEWPDNDNGLSTTHIKEFKINDITSSDA